MDDEFEPLTWVDAPPPSGRNRYLQWVADQLKANPGKWAQVAGRPLQPSAVKKGTYSAFRPAEDFECTNGKPMGSSKTATFIRYVGKSPSDNGFQRSSGRQERVDQLSREKRGSA